MRTMLLPRAPLFILCVGVFCGVCDTTARAQLTVLSSGDATVAWRDAQMSELAEQLSLKSLPEDVRPELAAQLRWLKAWSPGQLTDSPLWEPAESTPQPVAEPIVDPRELAGELRRRLMGPKAKPRAADTTALEELLKQHPDDIGVRQLHLHWLDQKQYRKTYPAEIAEAALKLASMLELAKPQQENYALARAYTLYQRARALAYRELPDVVEKQPIENKGKFEAELIGAYQQLKSVAGERAEFILIDVRMLRRDGRYGRALEMLVDHGRYIDKQWFLKKRRDLLRELGWTLPAKEAQAIYAAAFPEEAKAEAEGQLTSDGLD